MRRNMVPAGDGMLTDRGDDDRKLGEIFAAWQLTPNSLMLLGWQNDRPASEGTASLNCKEAPRGRFVGAAWPVALGRGRAYRFLVAVHLPSPDVPADTTLLLTGKRNSDEAVLARLPPHFLDATAFGAELARTAPAAAAVLAARFLLTVFTPAVIAANSGVRTMMRSFLDGAAEPEGCVEILGSVEDQCVIMQGWGRGLGPEGDVILADSSVRISSAQEAAFARPDINLPNSGHLLVLPPAALANGPVEAVYVLGSEGIRRRSMLPDQQWLSPEQTSGHLRDLLPTIRCDAKTRTVLAAALRPVYAGRNTLYEGGHPLRVSVDIAVTAPDAGVYLSGWLYDPANCVDSVCLKLSRTVLRIDTRWTRILRPDVTEAFAGDVALPACAGDWHDHGFAVHVPEGALAPGANPYLEVSYKDGRCGFMPLACLPMEGERGRARLLASVDLYKPSGIAVIERQLAPFLSRVTAESRPGPAVSPALLPSCTTIIVVPLPVAECPRTLLAHLLDNPLAPHEALLLVCGENWTVPALTGLGEAARFYGATARIVTVEGRACASLALRVAATVPGVEQVLLLGADTVGRVRGWRRALEQVAADYGGLACVSPSVLYEDGSVQFAGSGRLEPLPAPPYVRVPRHFAGFYPGFVAEGPAVISEGVSMACCLLPRRVVQSLAQRMAPAVITGEPELDLLLQLQDLSPDFLWTPAVQVFSPEDTPAAELARNAERLVAAWCVRAAISDQGA